MDDGTIQGNTENYLLLVLKFKTWKYSFPKVAIGETSWSAVQNYTKVPLPHNNRKKISKPNKVGPNLIKWDYPEKHTELPSMYGFFSVTNHCSSSKEPFPCWLLFHWKALPTPHPPYKLLDASLPSVLIIHPYLSIKSSQTSSCPIHLFLSLPLFWVSH